MQLSRRRLLTGSMVAAASGLAGCGHDQPAESTPTPSSTPTPAPPRATPTPSPAATPGAPRWPLTGRPLTDPTAVLRTPVAVKVPDTKAEHPQRGVNAADIVFVELDGYRDARGESGTRIVPIFHSSMPDAVGPVRSIRPVDLAILGPAHAVLGSTGGAPWVTAYAAAHPETIDATHTYLKTKGSGAYSIDRSRVRTYQGKTYFDRAVVCHPAQLAKFGKPRTTPIAPYFPWAADAAGASTAKGAPASGIAVPWKRKHSYDMRYQFDAASGLYRRSMPWGPHTLADGARVTTDNVLIIKARQRYGKLYAGGGHQEPLHDIINAQGAFLYAHGGKHVRGTWKKKGLSDPFTFVLADGKPLKMAPGRTWVELVNTDADVRFS